MVLLPIFLLSMERGADREFLTGLYTDYYAILRYAATRIVKNGDSAGDLVNEAFVRLMDKIPVLRGLEQKALRAYLLSTVRNVAINYVRARDRQSQYSFLDDGAALSALASDEPSPLDELLRRAELVELAAAIARMPARERALLEMKYYQKLSDAEIAGHLAIKPASVRYYLTLARRKLAGYMEGGDDGAR